jgi:hypothetical protein
MALSETEREKALRDLETAEEKAEREARESAASNGGEPPRKRGRPPGSTNKPKEPTLSDGAIAAGCRTLVRMTWGICHIPARIAGGKLTPLSDKEIDEGAEEARGLCARWPAMIFVLTIIGFPGWVILSFQRHFERKPGTLHALHQGARDATGVASPNASPPP